MSRSPRDMTAGGGPPPPLPSPATRTPAPATLMDEAVGDEQAQFYTAREVMPYITAEEQATLRQEALTTINNELVRVEDLEVSVPRLLRACATEATELRRAMNSIASTQMVEAQRALQMVQDSDRQVEQLRRLFLKQGELIQGLASEDASHAELRQLHILRENVNAVIEWSVALKEVRYGNLYSLAEEWHFAELYEHLKRLQRIRRTVITKAGAKYITYQAFFEPYFTKLDTVLRVFVTEVINMLANDSMSVAIQKALEDDVNVGGVPGTVAEDFPEFVALKECVAVCSEELAQPVLQYRSDGAEETPPLTGEVVNAAVAASVLKLWQAQVVVDLIDPFQQVSAYLEQMKRLEPLLEALEFTLIPLSTSSFALFAMVVRAAHAQVMRVLRGYLDPSASSSNEAAARDGAAPDEAAGGGDNEVEATQLMAASEFVQWYKAMLTNCNYTVYVDLTGLDDLAAAFITRAVVGLSGHLTRLCRACAITVSTNPAGPTILPSGIPITTGPVDMFAVLRQSLSGLSPAIDMPVLCQIGRACAEAILAYLDECKQRSDFDYWEDENDHLPQPQPGEEWQQRRLMFLYAFCNDCTTIENNLDTVELKFAACWDYDALGAGATQGAAGTLTATAAGSGGGSSGGGGATGVATPSSPNDAPQSPSSLQHEDSTQAASPFQRVQDTLLDDAFHYLDEIVLQVERVVGSQWALLFRAGPWYSEEDNPTQLIVNTEIEYLDEEFTVMLQEQRLKKITRQMLIHYVEKYIATLVEFLADVIRNPKKNGVASWSTFVDCLVRDSELFASQWGPHMTGNRAELFELATRALELCKDLLVVRKTVDFNFLLQHKLLDDFGDCPSFVIRFFLTARQDELDKDARDRMLAIWQERIAYQQRDKSDRPTIGWHQPASFFGAIDPSLADLERTTRLFGKSVRKKRLEEQQRKVAEEKAAKRAARQARHAADVAASAKNARGRKPGSTLAALLKPNRPDGGEVEVAALSDVLH